MSAIDKLTEQFIKFPGIGPRQARRFVYFLMKKDASFVQELSRNLLKLKDEIRECESCHRFFAESGIMNICSLCTDQNADRSTMMVVEKDEDLENFRKSNVYTGKYFVLGGTIPILDKEPRKKVRVDAFLFETERRLKEEGLHEIIFALSANPEGENTVDYLKNTLEPFKAKLSFSSLGRGLSTGSEIEYSDSDTLRSALEARK